MCGIAGIVDLRGDRDVDRDALTRMTAALSHRGPDDESYFIAPGVGFGHRRLAIIDIDGGKQPVTTQARGCVLSFNGEVYNFKNLRQDLVVSGLTPRSCSDSEVLAEGLARHGASFLDRVRGVFAFSFWDPGARRLTLGRDRLGEKPLYYMTTDDGFLLFASEISALVESKKTDHRLSPKSIADYFFYGYIPDPSTIYEGVYKLPPGCLLTAGPGCAPKVEKYWQPEFNPDTDLSYQERLEEFLPVLDDAVQSQMISDAPICAFLSGGLDSASIVSSMAETGASVTTCTIGFSERGHDERGAARVTAEKFSTQHFDDCATLDAATLIDDVARAFGEPFADSSALPSFLAAKLARQHGKVVLTGDGGDEVFAGYRRYRLFRAEERLRRLAPPAARQVVFGNLGAAYPKLDWAPQPIRLKTTLEALAVSSAQGYAAACASNLPVRAADILSEELKEVLGSYHPGSVVATAFDEADGDDALLKAQYADMTTWLPGRMLTKLDRMSMAHGLEARAPLLDPELFRWAAALPSGFKLRGGVGKRIFKAALAPRLGKTITSRPKRGFDAPVSRWLRGGAPELIARLSPGGGWRPWRDSGVINENAVQKMLRDHKRGARDCGQELWSVLMFDAFLRNQ